MKNVRIENDFVSVVVTEEEATEAYLDAYLNAALMGVELTETRSESNEGFGCILLTDDAGNWQTFTQTYDDLSE